MHCLIDEIYFRLGYIIERMRMVDIIAKKRDGLALTEEEIRFFIEGYSKGDIPDYQASAFTMAVLFQGMDKKETAILTDAMMYSGETVDLSGISGIKVDKHSTGGVGDKTSLAVLPLVASLGVKVAKMSGRGLGHTGGTLDKLESIPGTRIFLSKEEFFDQVERVGLAVIGQTAKIDPADKKLYALRDVTATVESIPLIASSIMSKKLASGSDAILLDVKFGCGAFMKTFEQAKTLAQSMVDIGDELGRDTRAILTDMEQPLGNAVGNSLEVKEAIDTLNGHGPADFVDLCISAGAILLEQAKKVSSFEEGQALIIQQIENREGLKKLAEFVEAQGGDPSYIYHPEKFPLADHIIEVRSKKEGYVKHIDSLAIGLSAMKLGAGRETMEDKIDMASGIVLGKKVGSYVAVGDVLAVAHTNKKNYVDILKSIEEAFLLVDEEVAAEPIVHAYIKK